MTRRRLGYTLTELLVVIVLTSTVLTTMTVCLYSLHRADRTIRDDLDQQIQLQRFTEALRVDVHPARDVAVNAEGTQLTMSALDETTIRYTIDDGWIDRVVERNASRVSGDQYRLPPGAARWQLIHDRERPLVALQLSIAATPVGKAVAETIRIVAARLPDTPAMARNEE
jgi:hypothetical protein